MSNVYTPSLWCIDAFSVMRACFKTCATALAPPALCVTAGAFTVSTFVFFSLTGASVAGTDAFLLKSAILFLFWRALRYDRKRGFGIFDNEVFIGKNQYGIQVSHRSRGHRADITKTLLYRTGRFRKCDEGCVPFLGGQFFERRNSREHHEYFLSTGRLWCVEPE